MTEREAWHRLARRLHAGTTRYVCWGLKSMLDRGTIRRVTYNNMLLSLYKDMGRYRSMTDAYLQWHGAVDSQSSRQFRILYCLMREARCE